MIRRTRLLDRSVHQRDARFFVVATEGAETEPRYFHAIQERDLVPRSRVKLHVLPTEDGRSAPHHLAARIEAFLREYTLLPDDEVWLVLDMDIGSGNRIAQLSGLVTLCGQKRWRLAISNPCFEVWLLLHVSDDLTAITARADSVTTALRARLGSYSKSATPTACLDEAALTAAIQRAQAIDTGPSPWPTGAGTHVHKLMATLRASLPGA
ncbi:MAG: RloB family protein [Deltaproteobacteria bacterium]|nr:RloB family protein [Myxococcales bacterium]MDP3215620.1 RloB family protein [Deltaproteobacteria bacterium]